MWFKRLKNNDGRKLKAESRKQPKIDTMVSDLKEKFSVSVIITTFNRKQYLKRSIDSVLHQTRAANEIIIIDDGSTDDTGKLIASEFSNLKYVWQENHGISHARNQGISESGSNWIAFLDADDEWLPQKLAYQIAALESDPEHKVCHTNEIWIRNGRRANPQKKHQKFGGWIFDKCLPLCVISPSSVLIHRSVFDTFGKFDESLPVCEDYDFWLRICAFIPVLYIGEAQIIKYGGHRDQLSKKYWGMDRFRIISLEKIINNPDLKPQYRKLAVETLIEKIEIYITGADKRNKSDDVESFKEKKKYYLNLI